MTIAAPRVPSWQHPATCPGEAAPDTRPEPEHLGHGGPEAGQCEQCRHHQHSERSHHARILNPFFRFIHRFSGEYILHLATSLLYTLAKNISTLPQKYLIMLIFSILLSLC